MQTLIKFILTSALVVASSEAAKRNVLLGAILASLPLTSLLAMLWLWSETQDTEKIAEFSLGIFWLVLPSLVLFLALPFLLRRGIPFAPSMLVSVGLTVGSYFVMLAVLNRFGVSL